VACDRYRLWILLPIIAIGLALRLPKLDARPMHADEAVQAARFRELWQQGKYRYDPREYHGPTLSYFTLPVIRAFAPADFAETTETMYRTVTVIFGIGLVILLPALRGTLGTSALLWAGLFTATSPAMVFYSRYYIHESLLVFFTMATIAAAWQYWRTARVGWCLAAGAGLGCMQATKETAVLAMASMAAAIIATAIFRRRSTAKAQTAEDTTHPPNRDSMRGWHFLAGGAMALAVAGLWFSSFLTNPRGVWDAVLTYAPWAGRASGDSPHLHPWYFYLQRLLWWHAPKGPVWSEASLLALAIFGWLIALFQTPRDERATGELVFVRWLGFYACVLAAIYAAIPYKTPWCMLGFHHAAILLAGFGASRAAASMQNHKWSVAVNCVFNGALVAALLHLAWQAYRASYVMPADPRNPYTYVQTLPDMQRLANDLASISGPAHDTAADTVKVIWRDNYYWPLPWYLRRMERVGYWDHMPSDPVAPLVIASPDYDEELARKLDATHLMTGYYALRPNVLAELWVSMPAWEAHLRRIGNL
jgi:uncharacterized protein (TIGR03663 family)